MLRRWGGAAMGIKDKLGCMEKRDLLNQTVASTETLLAYGSRYEELGMVHDAVDFYEKAGAQELLHRLLREAQNDGDLFLFKRICRILGHTPDRQEWLELSLRAEVLGKEAFAGEAERLADEGSSS